MLVQSDFFVFFVRTFFQEFLYFFLVKKFSVSTLNKGKNVFFINRTPLTDRKKNFQHYGRTESPHIEKSVARFIPGSFSGSS